MKGVSLHAEAASNDFYESIRLDRFMAVMNYVHRPRAEVPLASRTDWAAPLGTEVTRRRALPITRCWSASRSNLTIVMRRGTFRSSGRMLPMNLPLLQPPQALHNPTILLDPAGIGLHVRGDDCIQIAESPRSCRSGMQIRPLPALGSPTARRVPNRNPALPWPDERGSCRERA